MIANSPVENANERPKFITSRDFVFGQYIFAKIAKNFEAVLASILRRGTVDHLTSQYSLHV